VTVTRLFAAAAAALAVVLAAGCSAERPDPSKLEKFEPKIAGREVWRVKLDKINFPLAVAVRNGRFHAADSDGTVVAIDAETGREAWRARTGTPLSAGVGSDGRYASVVTRDNEVVAFDAGRELWRKRVPSRVVTPPLVAGERVFVMSVDRVVHAFDVLDGRRLWTLQRPGDALTLAQAGVLAPYKNTLLVGQGPRLAAVDPLRGTLQWEVAMATPRGSNEVERLADLIGPLVREGDRVCARAFQAAVACADASRGTLLWTRNSGGVDGLGGSAEALFGADANDRVTAWRASNGEVLWQNEKLLYRGLSGGLAVGNAVAFGDFQGYVHFLSQASGEFVLRLPTDGSAVVGTPVLAGNTMLVATRDGGLFAFRPN
jgi:outer membrane protein assembly factor BamB